MRDGAGGIVLWEVASPQGPLCNDPQDTTTRALELWMAGPAWEP